MQFFFNDRERSSVVVFDCGPLLLLLQQANHSSIAVVATATNDAIQVKLGVKQCALFP